MSKTKWPHLEFPHTQEIRFDNGETRVLEDVVIVKSGKWTHILCDDRHGSSEVIVNPDRVLFIRIKKQ